MPVLTIAPTKQDFSHQWKTSIQKGVKGNEKRSALFTWPRLSFSSDYNLGTYEKYSWMKRQLYANIHNLWDIPIWYDKTVLTSNAASGQAILNVESSANRHFYEGREVLLNDNTIYETGTILSINPANTAITLTANLTNSFLTGTSVFPLYKFRIEAVQELKKLQGDVMKKISFDCIEEFESERDFSYNIPTSGLETYLGHDLFLFPAKHNITSTFEHPYDLLQMLGVGHSLSHYDETELSLDLSFNFNSKEKTWNFLKTFDSKMGRLTPFWIPTGSQDIVVTSSIGVVDTVIEITNIEYSQYYLPNSIINRHIQVVFPGNNRFYRKIIDATSTTITIDNAMGIDGLPELVSFLIFSRFDIDELTISCNAKTGNVVNSEIKTKGLVEEIL